ncbi:putative spermidine/putrescine transport system substrate-binding protein [Sinorhizobium terangae]|uniref:Extracellular solute-binding protein n=1 Tax=Sinorhizobium terangae TaxID=110322 RepID=A0A6N7LRR0_SINTE|nr:extracellular solute-binding protein [Sinorhizobium terangae]MBB4186586.1 putative spermidine/putrescine transport system substrate-binding protein [Sinorhizobium terangae]MQX19165.1 extracellular solute-binding protein [Sinorhizobium terangae]
MKITRRNFVGGVAGMAGLSLIPTRGFAQAKAPSAPVTITVVDVAGNLALTQGMFENYAAAKPEWVSSFAFTKAPAPELPSKIKAQQAAGKVDIDLVLTGTDALSAGLDQGLWVDLSAHKASLPNLESILLPQAFKMQALAKDQGVVITYYPSGPLIEYIPERVATPPKTAAELLEWTKANPKRFMYARPANSGPGRTFLMGLPYLLGDSDPHDPVNGWSKTWEYLKALGENIEYYGTGTTQVMKELGEGTRDIVVTTTGWDINPRVLGIVPAEAKVGTLEGFHWVTDAHYAVIPKGVSEEKVGVLIDVINFILQPQQQAIAFDEGYFYPGPAAKGVTLDMAPQESQDAIAEFGRPEYEDWIANNPLEVPLEPAKLVDAFRIWDEQIGASKG